MTEIEAIVDAVRSFSASQKGPMPMVKGATMMKNNNVRRSQVFNCSGTTGLTRNDNNLFKNMQ